MPKVFVHGNPETSVLWRPLFECLRSRGVDDLVALSPPGFGSALPSGFEPTQVAYRDWLIGELEGLGGGIDLVGHDWGAGHVYGVLAKRPDLLRSWATDCAGLVHRDYVWHDLAQAWQTPEVGEQAIVGSIEMPIEQRVAVFIALGIPEEVAHTMATEQNDALGRCVLELYRSASQPAMAQLGERLQTTPKRPGLVIIATADHYAGTPEMAASVARDLGAEVLTLEGLDHWWMFAGREAAADGLVAHWQKA